MKNKGLKLEDLFESEHEDLKLRELMEVQGGSDEDLDEDCYVLQCVVASSCAIMSCVIYS